MRKACTTPRAMACAKQTLYSCLDTFADSCRVNTRGSGSSSIYIIILFKNCKINSKYMKKIYIFIILLVSLLFFLPITEGFGFSSIKRPLIGEYDYLAPVPESNTWSQETIDNFIDKCNSVNELSAERMLKSDTFINVGLLTHALEEEATYFIDNGKWPINNYVTEYLTKHKPPIFGQPLPERPDKVYNLETLSERMPNRLIYQLFISTSEMQMNPLPMSYQIFKGTVKPPSSNTVPF